MYLLNLLLNINLSNCNTPLGCGNGGLDWNIVKSIIIDKLQNYEAEYNFFGV